jgi:alkylation response protein AidB-like acyl-CoA dehydrogenase
VFFDNVRVPLVNRLGEEHQGWDIGKYMLGLERFGTAEVSRSLASLGRLKRLAASTIRNGTSLMETSAFAVKVGRVETKLRALEVTEQRFLFRPGGAHAMGAEACVLKILGTELQQRIYELTVEALGYDAHYAPQEETIAPISAPGDAGNATRAYFNFRKTSIYSGSNEIQKNIIAKAVLGL